MAKLGRLNLKTHYALDDQFLEFVGGVSATIPDETLTIRQIMEKHVRGMKIADELYKQPIYEENASFDSDDLEAVKRMDFDEKHEFVENLKISIATQKENLKKAQKAIKQSQQQQDPKGQKAAKMEEGSGETTELLEERDLGLGNSEGGKRESIDD